ncbi:MAG: hypothetical protein OHK0029_00260 [Armatimonadaceae bacterium]
MLRVKDHSIGADSHIAPFQHNIALEEQPGRFAFTSNAFAFIETQLEFWQWCGAGGRNRFLCEHGNGSNTIGGEQAKKGRKGGGKP